MEQIFMSTQNGKNNPWPNNLEQIIQGHTKWNKYSMTTQFKKEITRNHNKQMKIQNNKLLIDNYAEQNNF